MASSTPTEVKEKPNNNQEKKRRPPSAEEVLAHYEAQGLETREASLKAIKELQLLLYRSVSSSSTRPGAKDNDSIRKLDNVNTRLAILDMKLDSKPSYPQSLAIGVAAQAIFTALSSIYNIVRSATRGSPPS